MLQIAIIGYGYWGKNLVRNFYNLPDSKLALVIDQDANRLKTVQQLYPHVEVSTSIDDAFKNHNIDAVVIATPVFTHYALAKEALLSGKHVLVEKPMTASSAEAKELIDLALSRGKLIMPDHTFLYTGAVQKMKELVTNGTVGNIQYIDSTRINLGLFQPDINVLWDLAPHDLSICDYLIEQKPYSVQATGISHTNNGIENVAYLTVNYENNLIAHFNCSWTSPVKVRSMLIGGDKKMISYNDLEATEKIKVYDTGYDLKTEEEKTKIMVDYRVGDIYVPKLDGTEALSALAKDFVQSILHNQTPRSHAELGLTVVQVLEAAQKSIKQKGQEVIL
ncbi:MAG: gfo/Idh/MocA family oxidoreductase [Bacteroidetes bacterium]|nr:MAG: gfo/Idh/MocA family oxidoreductase [Bacteroidota bacterium]